MFGYTCTVERESRTGTKSNGQPIVALATHYDALPCSFPQERPVIQDEEPEGDFVTERYTVRVPSYADVKTGDLIVHVRTQSNVDTGFGTINVLRSTPRRTHREILCRRAE